MSEAAWPLRWAMAHFGSGDALFFGCFLLFFAARAEAWGWRRRWVTTCARLGLVWIVLSAWPSLWLQAVLLSLSIAWLLAHRFRGTDFQSVRILPDGLEIRPTTRIPAMPVILRRATVALIFVAFAVEWPYHWPLRLRTERTRGAAAGVRRMLLYHWPLRLRTERTVSIAVIGDSVTAGLNPGDRTWPQQVAERWGWTVFDASQQGAIVHTALQQLATLDDRGEVLVLEIGGIDVLEQSPVAEFTRDLEALLSSAHSRYRTVVMVELPLPPLANRYGLAQRSLALRYGVRLIPKREFIGVLASAGGTVDGVHLSNSGQTRLADVLHRALGGTGPAPGDYQRCEPSHQSPTGAPR